MCVCVCKDVSLSHLLSLSFSLSLLFFLLSQGSARRSPATSPPRTRLPRRIHVIHSTGSLSPHSLSLSLNQNTCTFLFVEAFCERLGLGLGLGLKGFLSLSMICSPFPPIITPLTHVKPTQIQSVPHPHPHKKENKQRVCILPILETHFRRLSFHRYTHTTLYKFSFYLRETQQNCPYFILYVRVFL